MSLRTLDDLQDRFEEKVLYSNCYNDIVDYLRHNSIPYNAGTKRIVIDHPKDNGKCIKIAYKESGVQDNEYDLIMSHTILEGRDIPRILTTNVALSYPYEIGSAFMIVAEKAIIPSTFGPLLDWAKKEHTSSDNLREIMLKYIASIPSLRNQYNDIREGLRKIAVEADTDIYSEPFNYAFKMNNKDIDIILIDIGSVIPRVGNIYPKCPKCNAPLVQRIKTITTDNSTFNRRLKTADITLDRGMYRCTDRSCSLSADEDESRSLGRDNYADTLDKMIGADYTSLVDTEVFTRYVSDVHKELKEHKIYIIGRYYPTIDVRSYDEYIDEMERDHKYGFEVAYKKNINGKYLTEIMYDRYLDEKRYADTAEHRLDIRNVYEDVKYDKLDSRDGYLSFTEFERILVDNYAKRFNIKKSTQDIVEDYLLDSVIKDCYFSFIVGVCPELGRHKLRNGNLVYDILDDVLRVYADSHTINAIIDAYENRY